MSCAERVETQGRVWAWCRGWMGMPYPCRRIRTEVWFQYEFHQTRYVPSWFPFWEKREGCCEDVVYGGKSMSGGTPQSHLGGAIIPFQLPGYSGIVLKKKGLARLGQDPLGILR